MKIEAAFTIEAKDGVLLKVHVADHVWHKLFAGLAMQGLVTAFNANLEIATLVAELEEKSKLQPPQYVAAFSVRYADALVAELEKDKNDDR